MLFRWLFGSSDAASPSASDELRALVARSMPGADPTMAATVGAVAGLLASVAHADRVYTPEEEAHVREALSRVTGLGNGAVDAVANLLAERMDELAHESLQTYTRVLYEQLERGARLEVLDVLMDLAAADQVLAMEETNLLRRIARGLGLSDHDYLVAQERHRMRLSVLSP
jgi:uncharacterized tellurite resistance protein B-like protein